MKFNAQLHARKRHRAFSLVEAMVAVALMGLALASTFSLVKVAAQGKATLDDRSNFYLASISFSANLGLAMMEILPSDTADIAVNEIVYTVNGACPSTTSMTAFKARVQTELCKIKFITSTQSTAAVKSYRVQLVNKKTVNGSTSHLAFKLSFIDPTNNTPVFERVLLYVK